MNKSTKPIDKELYEKAMTMKEFGGKFLEPYIEIRNLRNKLKKTPWQVTLKLLYLKNKF